VKAEDPKRIICPEPTESQIEMESMSCPLDGDAVTVNPRKRSSNHHLVEKLKANLQPEIVMAKRYLR
jgi:hypothetical protein